MAIIYLTRGDDLSFDVTITRDGQPYPILPGTDVVFVMKSAVTDPDSKSIRKSIGYGILLIDPVASKVRVSLTPADSVGLPNVTHMYPYEIKVVDLAGNVFTVLSDFIKVNASVMQGGFSSG
jgi:hypothetical protein